MMTTWIDMGLASVAAILGAGILLVLLRFFEFFIQRRGQKAQADVPGPTFLFKDGLLADASSEARAMIAAYQGQMTDYDAVMHILTPHFPNLRSALDSATKDTFRIEGQGSENLAVEVRRLRGVLLLKIKSNTPMSKGAMTDVIERDVRLSELALLREMTQHSPQLIWHENENGRLIWANKGYLAFCDRVQQARSASDLRVWPDTPLFPELHSTALSGDNRVRRLSIVLENGTADQWFDVTSVKRSDGMMHFATDANAVVLADQKRRQFVQTLSKTFADLSIGLAIFNKRRELSMFNPALLDMTKLPIDFLSQRPTLDTVLDRLRETRMLPEPKNYANWRDHFTAMEAAAIDGRYTELWNLPDGQTYRVTGRPHPDGAFAFLFEDISAEVSLTRRFRSDIETGQAVLDTLPDAIAVFSSAGTLVISNAAYCKMWDVDPDDHITPQELQASTKIWQSRCAPTKVWADLNAFVHLLGPRKPWSERMVMLDGRALQCNATPVAGGKTLVKFSFAPPAKPVISKLMRIDPTLMSARP